MRNLHPTVAFKRDWKKIVRSGQCTADDLQAVTDLLCAGSPLPERMHDHPLSGQWAGSRDCHIAPDLLLIYTKSPDEIRLLRLASHAELF